MANKEMAHLLRSVAAVYLLKGGNRFKVIAYERAADTVEHLTQEIYDIWENGKLNQVSGIGPSILSHIGQYFKKAEDSHLEKIARQIPASVFELMKVPGLGPKRSYKLVKTLKLKKAKKAVDDLEDACRKEKVAPIASFGQKSQEDILKSIKLYRKMTKKKERMLLYYAYRLAQDVIEHLKKNQYVKRAEALGSLRRRVSTIGDVDIAAVCHPKNTKEVINHFVSYCPKLSVEEKGEKKAAIISSAGKRVDLRLADKTNYGPMLQYFTGSKEHNIRLREYGLKKGYSLSEYGIKKIKTKKSNIKNTNGKAKIFKFKTEKEFYRFLGLSHIPPEIREGTDEIELAKKGKIPKLVEIADIQGDLHLHSSYDLKSSHDLGENSYREILLNAKNLGYQYVGFGDHNPSITNQTEEQIVQIMRKRKEWMEKNLGEGKDKVKYFISLEVDILPDGKIALPEAALAYVDFITVSIHSRFRMGRQKMTKRILKSLSYPKVKILGHPTGRLLMKREEIDVDWQKVFEQCKKKGVALEINSSPDRLDLPDVLVRKAVEYGLKLAINTDAHQVPQMNNIFFGVAVARRGWAKKSDIINSWNFKRVRKWLVEQ